MIFSFLQKSINSSAPNSTAFILKLFENATLFSLLNFLAGKIIRSKVSKVVSRSISQKLEIENAQTFRTAERGRRVRPVRWLASPMACIANLALVGL